MDDAREMLKERIKEKGSVVGADGTLATIKTENGSYEFPDPVAFYRATRDLLPNDEDYAMTVKPSVTKTKDALAKAHGIPKTSKRGQSAANLFADCLGHLCTQGTREKIVYQTA
jgi:hypothetical protein